jgi:hypothetical protein
MNCCKRARSGFLNVFKPVQALLLSSLRFLCPRMSRDVSAERPRKGIGSRPQQQPVREHGLTTHPAQTRIVHVRKLSAIAFCPGPQTRKSTVLGHEPALACAIREQAAAADRTRPSSIHDLGMSLSSTAPLTRTFHGWCGATEISPRHIRMSVSPPTQYSVHVQIILGPCVRLAQPGTVR